MNCNHDLGLFDLIPLFSFLFLKGKCRYCKEAISWQYPIVELITGILFLGVWLSFGLTLFTPLPPIQTVLQIVYIKYTLIMLLLMIVLSVIDYKTYRLPNKIVFPMIGVAIFLEPLWGYLKIKHEPILLHDFLFDIQYLIKIISRSEEFSYHFLPDIPAYIVPLLAALFVFLFLLMIHIVTKGRGMGLGDVKYGIFMGLFVGWPGSIMALYLAFGLGAVVSLLLMVAKKKSLKDRIPFGPFLIIGTIIALFIM